MFHWDSPQALEDLYGSWRSREMAKDFADYCTATVQRLGDRITHWMTINEIIASRSLAMASAGCRHTRRAPWSSPARRFFKTVHHALLAHGLGCQAIRAAAPGRCHVSLVENFKAYVPVMETPEHIVAVRRAFVSEEHNGTTLVPALTGATIRKTWSALGIDAPDVHPADLKTINQPLDALGFNVYTGSFVRAADNARGYEVLPMQSSYPKMNMPWLNFLPESPYWGVRMIGEALGGQHLPVYVSENGCASEDQLTAGARSSTRIA